MRYSNEQNYGIAEDDIERGEPVSYIVNNNPVKKLTHSHYHTYYEFTFMLSGEQHLIMDNDTYTLYSGQFVFFAPYIMHNRFSKQVKAGERFVMYFTDELLDPEVEQQIRNATGCYAPSRQESAFIRDKLILLSEELDRPCSNHRLCLKYALNDLLLYILKSAERMQAPEKRQLINEIIAYINHSYYEDISTSAIADHFFISSEHLCRQFKKYIGQTVTRYINMIRILNARKALEGTDKSITEISTSCGFTNLTHFYRIFREQTGKSPSRYRSDGKERMHQSC